MKVFYLFAVFLCVQTVSGNWLSDLFTGLSEAVDDSKIKDLEAKVKKITGDVVKTFKTKTEMPNNDWVEVTKKYLKEIKFEDLLKTKDEKMEELVERWNNVLSELNNPEKFNSTTKLYKKITKDLKKMLPKDLFKKWKSRVHKIAKKIKESVSTHMKEINVETLKKHIKAWVEPTFMKHKENLEEEKQMVQDALKAANKKVMEGAKIVQEKIKPILKFGKDKMDSDESVQKWLEKTFTKPHHASRWIGKLRMEELKKQFPGVPVKKIKKLFKKMAKKSKKLIVIKKPIETLIKKIPIFTDEETKLKKLTPAEQAEYKEAEADWEKKMLMEALAVSKKLAMKGDEKKTPAPTTMTKKDTSIGGNWLLPNNEEQEKEEEEEDDKDEVVQMFNFQRTKPKLNKDFAAKLAAEESQWYDMRKKLKAML